MSVYGVSGSGTYAVSLTGLDEMMGVLPDNDVNQIRASDVRNVVLTLWDQSGGGGAGSFSYTHNPVSEASTIAVGGIPVGTTFDNVPLQTLFDNMFYPAVGGSYTIRTSPAALEFGNPSNKTDVIVSITKKTPTITSINVSNGQGGLLSPPPTPIPVNFNDNTSKTYEDVTVIQNTNTTYTLTVVDSTGTKTPQASVTWFFPRWYGSINLLNPNLNAGNFSQSEKTAIVDLLKGANNNWAPIWDDPAPNARISFKAAAGQLSDVTVIPINTNNCHIVLIWPKSDYGGDGDPSGYTFGVQAGRPFIDLGEHSVRNQYGNLQTCRIWIKDFKSAGTESFTINN
jgi:hypothetical protein